MDRASCSNIELHNYAQAPQNDTESGVRQDGRSCGTRAFKWIVRHPFLTATAIIGVVGVVGVASAGIYGLTLLGAAAPVATALSSRNVTAKALATDVSTTKASTTEASTTEASTTEASIFRSENEKLLNSRCKAPCAFNAKSAECTGNRRVNPLCCLGPDSSYWVTPSNGVICETKSQACTNKSLLLSGKRSVFHSMEEFCQSKGWGKAIYRIP